MSFYSTDHPPPDRSEVPGAIAALLDEDIVDGGGIETQAGRKIKPDTGVTGRDPPWSRVRIMIPETIFPGGQPMPDRSEVVRVQVVVEAAGDPNQLAGWDYGREIARIHREVFETINGTDLDLDRSSTGTPIWFHGWINDRPHRNDARRVWFQSADYRVVLRSAA